MDNSQTARATPNSRATHVKHLINLSQRLLKERLAWEDERDEDGYIRSITGLSFHEDSLVHQIAKNLFKLNRLYRTLANLAPEDAERSKQILAEWCETRSDFASNPEQKARFLLAKKALSEEEMPKTLSEMFRWTRIEFSSQLDKVREADKAKRQEDATRNLGQLGPEVLATENPPAKPHTDVGLFGRFRAFLRRDI